MMIIPTATCARPMTWCDGASRFWRTLHEHFSTPRVAPKEVEGGGGWTEVGQEADRQAHAESVRTPGHFNYSLTLNTMSNFFHLFYAISKRTPPSPKAWRAIAEVQAELNRSLSWTCERLSLSLQRPADRAPLSFPFVRLGLPKQVPLDPRMIQVDGGPVARIDDAAASGATKVRDSLLNAHYVVAFLRLVSERHPELLLELRDEGGFVLPGAVWIKGGKVELQRDWLNRERERVLEMSGDPNAAAPFVWAEAEALQGRFFADTPASDYAEVPEIREIGASWDELQSMSLGEAAQVVASRAAAQSSVVPA